MSRSVFSFCICLVLFCVSCTPFEPVSFGVILDHESDHELIPITVTLYRFPSTYQCTITPSESAPNRLHECDTNKAKHAPLTNDLNVNHMHLSASKPISIESIIVWDGDDNYHEINSFCPRDTTNACQNQLSISSTIIQFPSNDVLIHSPNDVHQANYKHTNANQLHERRRQMDTGNGDFDIDYFEFTLSDAPGSGIDEFAFEIHVYWRNYSFYCQYNTDKNSPVPVLPGETAVCNDSNAVLSPGVIPLDESFKFDIRYLGSGNDTMRIDILRVYTVNGNYFEIDEFCVPYVFNASHHINAITPCDLYPHKYTLSNIPIDKDFVPRLYVGFRDEIHDPTIMASYANQAFAGNVRLIEPTEVAVTLTQTAGTTYTNAGVDYALYWDEYIFKCEYVDATVPESICRFATMAPKQIECNHETQFMVRIYNRGGVGIKEDVIIIDSIQVNDGHTGYKIENFCISNEFGGIPQSGTQNGNCSKSHSTVPKWSEACVGDALSGACSDNAINILFPVDFLISNEIMAATELQSLEGVVESKDASVPATCSPTRAPTRLPTIEPTIHPTTDPTNDPTIDPTTNPTNHPTEVPTVDPTVDPTTNPTTQPTIYPTFHPTYTPTKYPTIPSNNPSPSPTLNPTINPSLFPTLNPTSNPTLIPTWNPLRFTTTDENNEDQDKLGAASIDAELMMWFNENTTNKIISGVAVLVLVLIVCLICYICSIKKNCCFSKKEDENAKPLAAASANSLKSSSPNSDARSLSVASAAKIESDRANSVQLVSMNSQPSGQRSASMKRKVSSITVPLHDEYIVHLNTKPFGMSWSTLKTDRYNLYVCKVEPDGTAARNNVKKGHKLVALNGESIEGIGSKKIYEAINAAGLPLSIMFRKRGNKRQRSLRSQTVPSRSGEGMYEGSYDNQAYDPLAPGTPVKAEPVPFAGINVKRLSELPESMITPPIKAVPKPKDGDNMTVNISLIDLDELSDSNGSADLMYVQHNNVAGARTTDSTTLRGPDTLPMSTEMMSADSAVLHHAVQNSADLPSDLDDDENLALQSD
eukprot:287823_1